MVDAGEQYAAQIEAARLAVGRGEPSAAVEALTEAIAFGERHFGAEHASLSMALNELSRLYIRQANHAHAEPVLMRLLQITRAKGDRHPDVATVLAGLAVAKRGLGDDASAEVLYRQALQIREDVLAPDHMATVITLEQLSDTCAARGNSAEALILLQRALLRRERVLGAEHATVDRLHARIAELEGRASHSSTSPMDAPVAPPIPAIEVAPASPAAAPTAEAPVMAASSRGTTATRPSRRRPPRYALVSAAVVVLAIGGLALSSLAANEIEQAPAETSVEAPTVAAEAAPATNSPAAIGAPAVLADARPDSAPAPSASDTAPATPTAPVALPRLRRIVVPKVAMPSVDSLIRGSVNIARETDSDVIGTAARLRTSASNDATGATPPVLIGPAPTPRFPEQLRARPIEGEVVVEFRVDEKGRVDPSSMREVQSPHELLTAAVRKVLPQFRFEPARSAGPDSKPESALVRFRTEFSVRN
jgi:TonB family protein